MTLAIDVGNTHIVIGLMKGLDVQQSWRIATDLNKTADEYFAVLQGLLATAGTHLNGVSRIVGASVVPPLESIFEELAEKHLKLPIQMVNYKTIPITVKISNPQEVGADRLVDAYAARELFGKPAIVIDFGTATTFDAISEKGEYLGGAIAPGLGIGRDALYEKTAKLPKVDLHPPQNVIGNGTDEAIRSGLLVGYAGLVEKLVAEFQRELGSPCKIVGTGGFVNLMAEQTNVIQIKDPDLTLKGLALLAA